MTTIEFLNTWVVPIAQAMQPVLVTVLATILTGAAWKLMKWLGFNGTAVNKANMEAELETAFKRGLNVAIPIIQEKGWKDPQAWATILSVGTAYFREKWPDRVNQIEAASQSAVDPVQDVLSARMPGLMATLASPHAPEASPAITINTGDTK